MLSWCSGRPSWSYPKLSSRQDLTYFAWEVCPLSEIMKVLGLELDNSKSHCFLFVLWCLRSFCAYQSKWHWSCPVAWHHQPQENSGKGHDWPWPSQDFLSPPSEGLSCRFVQLILLFTNWDTHGQTLMDFVVVVVVNSCCSRGRSHCSSSSSST